VLRLDAKEWRGEGASKRCYRKWGEAQTPFERLCATQVLDAATQARLRAQRDAINPRQLRAELYRLREQLFDLPLAQRPEDGWLISDEISI